MMRIKFYGVMWMILALVTCALWLRGQIALGTLIIIQAAGLGILAAAFLITRIRRQLVQHRGVAGSMETAFPDSIDPAMRPIEYKRSLTSINPSRLRYH